MKQVFKKILSQLGYDIRTRNFLQLHEIRRIKFLNDHNISLVLDVGSNEGQYAQSIRREGYKNRIISFEPVKQIFEILHKKKINDSKWQAMNIAIGDFDGSTSINISEFSQVSSILSATGLAHTEYWKGYRQEEIKVRKLDSLINELDIKEQRILLKVDTQGFEEKVLQGSQNLIDQNIDLLEVELSIQPFYLDEKLFPEMFTYIRDFNFELISMSPVHIDSVRGYVLQYDCIFIKKSILDSE